MSPTAQRIGILVIAFVLVLTTLASFASLVLSSRNAKTELAESERLQNQLLEEQQKAATELSGRYYPDFSQYQNRPAAFDAAAVGETVTTTDLKVGDGDEIGDTSSYRAYYLGWNPRGVVFDGSIEGEGLKEPLGLTNGVITGSTDGRLVQGWYDGVRGMRIGGIREITIPSDLGYGETGQGENIPPNTPIRFVIYAIPAES